MITNTKTLFCALLNSLDADCICDVGSRDGVQSLLFRDVRPAAEVIAFEANPINFRAMNTSDRLAQARIKILPIAAFSRRGMAQFHVTDVNYTDPAENTGTSSLLVHNALKIRESVEVETRRLDELLLAEHPAAHRIGLWIDVEGAEFDVLTGIAGIKDRVVVLHVETAKTPMRQGQHVFAEVEELLRSMGFVRCGSNIGSRDNWGDVVYVQAASARALGLRLRLCQLKGLAGVWLQADVMAAFLKHHLPWLYRTLRAAYVRLMT